MLCRRTLGKLKLSDSSQRSFLMPTNNASRPIVYLAIELSVSSWVVACRQPVNEKIKMHRMEAGDTGPCLLSYRTCGAKRSRSLASTR